MSAPGDVLAALKSMRLAAEAYLEAQGVGDDDDSYSVAIAAVAELVEAAPRPVRRCRMNAEQALKTMDELIGVPVVECLDDEEFIEAAKEARDFFADLVEREEWRPIETAPKNGTRIMLGNAHGVWIAEWRPVCGSGYVPDDPWFSVMLNRNHIDRAVRHEKATRWKPLPLPPPQEPQA